MQNFRLIIYTLPVIKERHHEGKMSLRVGVIKSGCHSGFTITLSFISRLFLAYIRKKQ